MQSDRTGKIHDRYPNPKPEKWLEDDQIKVADEVQGPGTWEVRRFFRTVLGDLQLLPSIGLFGNLSLSTYKTNLDYRTNLYSVCECNRVKLLDSIKALWLCVWS